MKRVCPSPVLLLLFGCLVQLTSAQNYALDRQSTCGQTITVYEQDLTLTARSNVAPANPPLECIVYLQSAYEKSDGRYRLQIIVQHLDIGDCSVRLALFNGRGATGNYLRLLGCSSSSTDIIYTTGRLATVRFSRTQDLYDTGYAITLTVRTYADGNEIGTEVGVHTLTTGAIIGIVIGAIVVIAVAILLAWCCCSGYINNFIDGARGAPSKSGGAVITGGTTVVRTKPGYAGGSIDSNIEKLSTASSNTQLRNGFNYNDPAVWSSLTGLNNDGNRNFRRGVPRKAGTQNGASLAYRPGTERATNQGRTYGNNGSQDSNLYEPYDTDTNLDRSPRFQKRQDNPRASGRSRGSRRSRNSGGGEGEGEGGGQEEPVTDSTDDDVEMLKKSLESSDVDKAVLHRFESEADVDTIASPHHINAGVRASVPDLTEPLPTHSSPTPKKRGSTSPRSRKRPKGHEPDPMALPPEAFDPVFTTPTSQEHYPGEFRPAPAMPFMPYGMYPMVPGQQMYAYAYQTAPQAGVYPGNQGAYFVQSVPTEDGDVQNTAVIMQSTRTPKRKGSRGKGGAGHPGAPDHTSTPSSDSKPDLSVVAAGAAPPDPGAGHRSMAMKSFNDPDSGIQTTQVLWTDNVPDPSDPKPGDSSQVTRKTTTRVTTRSGHGDMPTTTNTLLDEDPNPAFLAPSASQRAILPPATATPNTSNVDFYLGQGHRSAPVRPPEVVHEAPSRSGAIRDRISFGDSVV